jgi:hypothetical protein
MKHPFLFFAILFSFAVSAQNCTEVSVLQTPGAWKESTTVSSGIPAADLAREKKVLETISNMIKSKYTPMSLQANRHLSYTVPSPDLFPVNYYAYSIIPLNYYCESNTIKTAHETSTYFEITTNLFNREIYQTPDNTEKASGTGYHYISDMPVQKDGCWYFEEKDVTLAFGIPGKESEWLVTYDGKLPFAYVTKKEFLETQKKIVLNAKHMSASGFEDVLERNESEKGFKETEYKNDPEKLSKYMKMDYLPSKERYEKLLADNEKKYKPVFDKLEELLRLPASELKEQAIVKDDPHSPSLYLFTDDNDGFGQVLIKPNPGYFNSKLPRSAPQFFWIFIGGCHTDPIAAKFMKEIINAVDFDKLKSMLGK